MFRDRFVFALTVAAVLASIPDLARAQDAPVGRPTFDHIPSVYTRTIRPPEAREDVDWEARVTELLREEPGDVIVTAVGDMIFNVQISSRPEPERRQLVRLIQEADIAYGNLEFSMNRRPELRRPFYNFRTDPEFAWEVAAIGINLVSMANNHALDFGPEGLAECLDALDNARIGHAGAGLTEAAARAPESMRTQSQKLRYALLSYMRSWTSRYRCIDPAGPCLATIDPAEILVAGPDGVVETIEGPLAADVTAMEDDVVLAKRHNDVVMVSLHIHDLSHHRSAGVQDVTPPNEEITFRRAVDAGADVVLGSGPHVLRGIEIYDGKPIFYSLGDFIYQYRTPDVIPVDLIHQRDGEIERPANVSVFDRRDPHQVMDGVMARLTLNDGALKRIELIPITIDDEGPLYGMPRLASAKRAGGIIALMQHLSEPYGTTIVSRGWYAEVELP